MKLRKKVDGLQISPGWPRRDPPRLERLGQAGPGQVTIPSRLLVLVSGIRVARLSKKVKLRQKVNIIKFGPAQIEKEIKK